MAIKSVTGADIMSKTGQELLSEKIVEYFKGFRAADYQNVLRKKLSEYTWSEWLVCLKEKVLLEQCLPYVSEKLEVNPLIPGAFYRGEILYEVTQIEKNFWMSHQDWYQYFGTCVKTALSMIEDSLNNMEINQWIIDEYKDF